MQIIPYDDDGLHELKTPCPFGMLKKEKNQNLGVGSHSCLRCKFFIAIQRESNEVACNFSAGDMQDKEVARHEDAICSTQGEF